jgi:SAM-dependent methyltransferase
LDVATGNGRFLEWLIGYLPSFNSAIGIDADPTVRGDFRERFESWPSVRFRRMDARRLRFRANSFDIVATANAFCEFDRPETILAEMLRVLRAGGWIVVAETYRDGVTEPERTHVLMHDWWAEVDRLQHVVHHPWLTRAELVALLVRGGLVETRFFDIPDENMDPFDPDVIAEIDSVMERILPRSRAVPELEARGRELVAKLHSNGFRKPTALVTIGRRPERVSRPVPRSSARPRR